MTDPKQDVRQQFEAWHDKGWPEPKDSAPYHWKVEWHAAKDARWEVYQAALKSPAVRGAVEALESMQRPLAELAHNAVGSEGYMSTRPITEFATGEVGPDYVVMACKALNESVKALAPFTALRTLGAGHVE